MKKIIAAALVILVLFAVYAVIRDNSQLSEIGNIFGFLALLVLYFLPGLIASRRKHPQLNSIVAVNIFLGWTLVGWVVALAMSLSAIKKN